jgi:putative ABC transport system permease protein
LNDYTFLIDPLQYKDADAHINKVLAETFSRSLFNVVPFDNDANRLDIKIWSSARNTFTFFAIIAILIALVGIFGLVTFSTRRMVKEIGVRKVQGAKVGQLLGVVLKPFIVLLILANISVFPIYKILPNATPGAYKYQATILICFLSWPSRCLSLYCRVVIWLTVQPTKTLLRP